jgi:hypothetical protein
MIKYNLRCAKEHGFEAWFDNIDSFESQRENGLLRCPSCNSAKVERAIMAPAIPKKSNASRSAPTAPEPSSVMQMMQKMKDHVTENFDYVGDQFAEEARAIYYGEKEDRDIYGETSLDDARALVEEGVPVAPLPLLPDRAKN